MSVEPGVSYCTFCLILTESTLAASTSTQNDNTQISTLPPHIPTLSPKLHLTREHDLIPPQQEYQSREKQQ